MNRQYANHDEAIGKLLATPADEPVVLLHSGRFDERWARRSVMARPRGWYRYWADGRFEISDFGFRISDLTGNLWRDLRVLLHDERLGGFRGRWIGYFGYDVCRVIEREKLRPQRGDGPIVELAWCPEAEEMCNVQCAMCDVEDIAASDRTLDIAHCTSNFTREQYEAAVGRVIDYIAAGDVFQVNLSQQLRCEWAGNPRELFARLAAVSPAWYGAYLELPRLAAGVSPRAPGSCVLSTSPELFLQVENGHVITRPIKGTRPQSEIGNRKSEIELLRSSKDAAELNMIVDLMRNDLGKVCAYGSVKVTAARDIETHPTIHHGVATIEGDLHPSRDIVDLLRATLPGGSVTGAPKVRAMQIIDELEQCSRGVYCGAIGWLTKDACQFNVAIRTMTMERIADCRLPIADLNPAIGSASSNRKSKIENRKFLVTFPVGGGIVADSNPADEYDETMAKAQAMLRALGV
ncbi:MAG: anthranilate synthase component I family protein [Phycisphaerales bacterium]